MTWTSRTTSAPWGGRNSHTSVIDASGAIYVIGGIGESYPYYFNDVWLSTNGGARPDSHNVLLGGTQGALKVRQGGAEGVLRGTHGVLGVLMGTGGVLRCIIGDWGTLHGTEGYSRGEGVRMGVHTRVHGGCQGLLRILTGTKGTLGGTSGVQEAM